MLHSYHERKRLSIAGAAVIALGLVALVVNPVSANAAEGEASCGGTLASVTQSGPFCVVTERAIGHLAAGEAVTVAGNVKVDDSASTSTADQRAFLNAQVKCYVDGDTTTQVFGTNAVRNIYTGMTLSGVYPRGSPKLGWSKQHGRATFGCSYRGRHNTFLSGRKLGRW